jgi:hypothetical protein
MHVYRKIREGANWLYTVGYWIPGAAKDGGAWEALEDTGKEEEARQLVNYLNGGNGKPFSWNE